MKKEIIIKAVTASLAAANFVQDLNTYLSTAEDIFFKSRTERVVLREKSDYPIITNGYPELEEDDVEEMEMNIFQCGFIHYNYKIITTIIIASDITYAEQLASNFKNKLDTQIDPKYKMNSLWKFKVSEEPISPNEVVTLADKAEIFYSIMPGSRS